jgi:Rieske Fe-S protein
MHRRKFIQICVAAPAGSAACMSAAAHAADTNSAPTAIGTANPAPVERRYDRVKLVDKDGRAIRATSLKLNHSYVFHYPYTATPCFLLNLDAPVTANVALRTEAGAAYTWPGGVGRNRTVVAYSAICAHKLAYPARQVSFIGFRAAPGGVSARGKVIACCADKSVYDPSSGAKVLSGPAPQPLAAILLEHDASTDELYAVGTFGGEKFNEFFQKYDFKLTMEFGDKAHDRVTVSSSVTDLASYSRQTATC